MSAEITVSCEMCSGTGDATHGDRHTGTNMDRCRTCGGTGQVPARPGESRETSWSDAVPGVERAGTISILEERTQAAVRYFRDGAAVRTGVLPDHASHIAEVLQSLLAEPVPPRAAEPASDALTQARRLATDLAEERFRSDLAALFLSGAGDDHPWVQCALRALSTPARQEEGSRGHRLAPGVQARRDAGLARDGWEAWAPTPSHVLRIALRIDDEAVALLEAFSISGPWYANADALDGKRHRLGAGSSLAGAVQWCERITGYVVTEAAAPTPDANSGEAPGRDDQTAQKTRRPTLREMTDAELLAESARMDQELAEFHAAMEECGGRSGSPGERLYEEVDAVDIELKRRGLSAAPHPSQETGEADA